MSSQYDAHDRECVKSYLKNRCSLYSQHRAPLDSAEDEATDLTSTEFKKPLSK